MTDPSASILHLFLRALGMIHLINFSSILLQILPLVGKNGIASLARTLDRLNDLTGSNPLIKILYPTIFWIDASDNAITLAVVCGILAAAAVCMTSSAAAPAAVVGSRFLLFACWIVLLSLCSVGGEFFSFPWDWLLLETTLISLMLPNLTKHGRLSAKPDKFIHWALMWLCFRFYFAMGLEKIPSLNQNQHWVRSFILCPALVSLFLSSFCLYSICPSDALSLISPTHR